MLEQADLSLSLSKHGFKIVQKQFRRRLYELEQRAFEAKLPSMIVFEGWDAAGKGTTIREITRRLDARGFKVLPIQAARTHEKQFPWLWRFWMKIPRYGQIAIFDRSHYGRVLIERVEGLTSMANWIRAYEEINDYERTLAADGMIFTKFWLHISREEQLRRFVALSSKKKTAWQVSAEDWERFHKYDQYLAAVRDMINNTHTPHAPWTVVPATSRYYRLYFVYRTLIATYEKALDLAPSTWQPPEELEAAALEKKAAKAARKAAKKAAKEAARLEAQESEDPDEAETPAQPGADGPAGPDASPVATAAEEESEHAGNG